MRKTVVALLVCLALACVWNRLAALWDEREEENARLAAQVLELEARNAAMAASRRALEAARAENIRREVENADALEKITSGSLADDDYFDAICGMLRKAFEPGAGGAAAENAGRLHGSGAQ